MRMFLVTIGIIALLAVFGQAETKFDQDRLIGKWAGEGWFVLPGTSSAIGVDGTATFERDSTGKKILTNIMGAKFLFSYSAIGELIFDEDSDSLSWKVEDSFGKKKTYRGLAKGNSIVGKQTSRRGEYRIKLRFEGADSVVVLLSLKAAKDSTTTDLSRFVMGRVKD